MRLLDGLLSVVGPVMLSVGLLGPGKTESLCNRLTKKGAAMKKPHSARLGLPPGYGSFYKDKLLIAETPSGEGSRREPSQS